MMKLCVILLTLCTLIYGEWPLTGGSSARQSYADLYGPTDPVLLWEGTLVGSSDPPYIHQGKIVTNRGYANEEYATICQDLYTGDTLWILRYDPHNEGRNYPEALGCHNGIVFIGRVEDASAFNDTLFALDINTGKETWRGDSLIMISSNGRAITDKGHFLIETAQHGDLQCFHKDTGKRIWYCKGGHPTTPDHAGVTVLGKTAYVWKGSFGSGYEVVAINTDDGTVRYTGKVPFNGNFGAVKQHCAIYDPRNRNDKLIFATKKYDGLFAFRDNGEEITFLWKIPFDTKTPVCTPALTPRGKIYFANRRRVYRADMYTGTIEDSTIDMMPFEDKMQTPGLIVDKGDNIFYHNSGTDGTGRIFCFDKNMKELWNERFGRPDGYALSLSEDGLLVATGSGRWLKVFASKTSTIPQQIFGKKRPMVEISQGVLFYRLNTAVSYGTMKLYTAQGKLVIKKQIPKTKGAHRIPFHGIAHGAYIVQITLDSKMITKPIIIGK